MGGLFDNDVPKPPKRKKPEELSADERDAARRRALLARGRASTILTGYPANPGRVENPLGVQPQLTQ